MVPGRHCSSIWRRWRSHPRNPSKCFASPALALTATAPRHAQRAPGARHPAGARLSPSQASPFQGEESPVRGSGCVSVEMGCHKRQAHSEVRRVTLIPGRKAHGSPGTGRAWRAGSGPHPQPPLLSQWERGLLTSRCVTSRDRGQPDAKNKNKNSRVGSSRVVSCGVEYWCMTGARRASPR
jgi:hypothetical protein